MKQRTRRINLSLTESEYAEIHQRAHALDLPHATFCRTASLKQQLPQPICDREMLSHISRIGGNLNQFAHHLNSGGELTKEAAQAMREAISLTKEIRNFITGESQ